MCSSSGFIVFTSAVCLKHTPFLFLFLWYLYFFSTCFVNDIKIVLETVFTVKYEPCVCLDHLVCKRHNKLLIVSEYIHLASNTPCVCLPVAIYFIPGFPSHYLHSLSSDQERHLWGCKVSVRLQCVYVCLSWGDFIFSITVSSFLI